MTDTRGWKTTAAHLQYGPTELILIGLLVVASAALLLLGATDRAGAGPLSVQREVTTSRHSHVLRLADQWLAAATDEQRRQAAIPLDQHADVGYDPHAAYGLIGWQPDGDHILLHVAHPTADDRHCLVRHRRPDGTHTTGRC